MKKLSLFLLFILTLCSCTKEINNINDFSKFSTMTKETDKIDVTFDNHSGSPFYFTIDIQKEINEIMDIIFSLTFIKKNGEVNPGSNSSIKIIQDENSYSMNTTRIYESNNIYYVFSTDDLDLKINKLAIEAGAFDL